MRIRRLVVACILAALVATACEDSGGGGLPPVPPEPLPTAVLPTSSLTLADLVDSLDRDRIYDIARNLRSPSLVDWSSIESGTLSFTQKSALCEALSTQSANDVFGAVLAAGLNAASKRLRGVPIDESLDDWLGLAAGVVFETCPSWETLIFRPSPTLEPPWYTPDFELVIGDPSVAWRRVQEAPCEFDTTKGCWVFEVTARDGCSSLAVQLGLVDSIGVALESRVLTMSEPVAAGATTRFEFTDIYPAGTQGYPQYVTCT